MKTLNLTQEQAKLLRDVIRFPQVKGYTYTRELRDIPAPLLEVLSQLDGILENLQCDKTQTK